MDNGIQIAEFENPFPAQIFENELSENGIKYSAFEKELGARKVFFVGRSNLELALKIKDRVDKENAVSEQNHMHPFRRTLAVFWLSLIAIYICYEIYKHITGEELTLFGFSF